MTGLYRRTRRFDADDKHTFRNRQAMIAHDAWMNLCRATPIQLRRMRPSLMSHAAASSAVLLSEVRVRVVAHKRCRKHPSVCQRDFNLVGGLYDMALSALH